MYGVSELPFVECPHIHDSSIPGPVLGIQIPGNPHVALLDRIETASRRFEHEDCQGWTGMSAGSPSRMPCSWNSSSRFML